MNIEILHDHISTFTREVVDSGFKRDLDDYISSLPSSQDNIVTLKEIAGKMLSALDRLYTSDLPDSLRALLPRKGIRPFVEAPHNVTLRKLIENTEIQQQDFFNKLTQFLNQLKQQLKQNIDEITKIEGFIAPYLSADMTTRTEQDVATISIVFKEQRTISSLPEFTKTLTAWNRALPIYHQLLKSESPEDIQIIEVQNGSIDFIVNLDVDIAMNLAKLFKLGFAYEELARYARMMFRLGNEIWDRLDFAHWILLVDKSGYKASVHLHTIWSYSQKVIWLMPTVQSEIPRVIFAPFIIPVDLMKEDIYGFSRQLLQEDAKWNRLMQRKTKS